MTFLHRLIVIKPLLVLISFVSLIACNVRDQESIRIESPDGQIAFVLFPEHGSGISFLAKKGEKLLFRPSEIKLLSEDVDFNGRLEVANVNLSSVQSQWETWFGELSIVPDNYNQAVISLESSSAKLNLIVRAYDEGLAFAYEIPEQNNLLSIRLDDELISYRFDSDYYVWSTPKREPGKLTAQGEYKKIPLSQLQFGAERPLVIEYNDDLILALAEAKLVDYARLSFNSDPKNELAILSSLDGKLLDSKQDTITGALRSQRAAKAKVVKKLPFRHLGG